MKRRNFLKATLWTETLRLDIEGEPIHALRDLFISLPFDQQQTLLDRLQNDLQNRRDRAASQCHDTKTSS